MVCSKCGNEGSGKFCGKCGSPMTENKMSSSGPLGCPSCGKPIKAGAKFCGNCGYRIIDENSVNTPDLVNKSNNDMGFIYWNIQPGQIAVKLTENMILDYASSKGVIIHEGTKAILFSEGILIAELSSGSYRFEKKKGSDTGGVRNFFMNLFGSNEGKAESSKQLKVRESILKNKQFSIVICRSESFVLPFIFENLQTASIRTNIGIQIFLNIDNLDGFYRNFMLDRTVLAAESLAKMLAGVLESRLQGVVRDMEVSEIQQNLELMSILADKFNNLLASYYPFMRIIRVVKLETERKELERLQALRDELYISELELTHLAKRNEFMNRLNLEKNVAIQAEAKTALELQKALQNINKDKMLSDHEIEKFYILLENERRLHEAKSENELQEAIIGIRKSELLREDEISDLERSLDEKTVDHEAARAQSIALMQIRNRITSDKLELEWEFEIGNKQQDLEIEREKKRLDADLELRKREDSYDEEKRQKTFDFDKQEQLNQLEILRQAQLIRNQKEQAQHDRELEKATQKNSFELEKLSTFSGMTAEQIMVTNPDISPEVASAMAEKFKAKAVADSNDQRVSDSQRYSSEMKEFMQSQMEVLKDMAMYNAQIMSGQLNAKDRELERTQTMVDHNENRYRDIVQESLKGTKSRYDVGIRCEKCSAILSPDDIFCPECGRETNKKN